MDERSRANAFSTLGKMDLALASLRDGVAWTDGSGRLQWANDSFVRLVGRERLACVGRDLVTLLPLLAGDQPVPADEHPVQAVLAGAGERYAVLTLAGDDPILLGIRVVPLELSVPAPGVVCLLHDLTGEQQAEEALRRRNRELERFAFVASHDLKEPLRKIRKFADLIIRRHAGDLPVACLDPLEHIYEAAGRMAGLVRDLLDYSRLARGASRPFEEVDLDEVIRQVLSDVEVLLETNQARVEVGPLPTVIGDESQLYRLFQNLLTNGLKFARPGVPGRVRVTSRSVEAGRAVEVRVNDNGVGFDEQHADQIFQLFKRLHPRHEYEGTGMGLAICKAVVERHGGTIRAIGRPGRGTTVIVTLPRDPTGQPEP